MIQAPPPRCYPDTNVVIGRARKNDPRHKATTNALVNRTPSNIKILRTVYIESIKVISRKNQMALKAIQQAILKIAAEKGIAPRDIDGKYYDQILKEGKLNVEKDIVTYFDAIELIMKAMSKQGLNPFTSMGFAGDRAIHQDLHSISVVFLVNTLDDCIGCTNDRHKKMMAEIEGHLKSFHSFFDDGDNSRDREIAAEAMVVAWDIETKRETLFLTDDNDFHDALKSSIDIVSSKMKCNPNRFSVKKVV
jgi:hypothetical protein